MYIIEKVKEVVSYKTLKTVKCNECERNLLPEGKYFEDSEALQELMEKENWIAPHKNYHVCPLCYTIDLDDNLIIKNRNSETYGNDTAW